MKFSHYRHVLDKRPPSAEESGLRGRKALALALERKALRELKRQGPPKLYPYQREGVRLMADKARWKNTLFGDRVLLADMMGLGKTPQGLVWYKTNHFKAGCLVVVCPSIVKRNWRRECARFLGVQACVLEGRTPPKDPLKTMGNFKVYIVNYDILGSTGGRRPTWAKFLRRLKPSAFIIDEGQYIKSIKAKRTKNVVRLGRYVKNIAVLSGTPATNRPVELWPTLNLLRPDKFKVFQDYAMKFCEPKWTPFGWTFPGARNLDVLHRKLNRYVMIRRKADDVLKDLPPLTRVVVPIEPDPKLMARYREMEANFIAWLAKTSPERAHRARKAEVLVRMQALKKAIGEIKLPKVHEWLNEWLEETRLKIIMFGTHKNVVRYSHERYKEVSVLVDGGVTGDKREMNTEQFRLDKKTRVLFGNMQAAGTGFNGQAASAVGFMEIGWVPGELAQCEKRAHRIGQKNHVMSYIFIVPETIEERLLAVLQEKQGNLDQIFDGAAPDAQKSLNIYDILEEQLLASGRKQKRGYYNK